jgi:hypothetical protein
VVLGRNGRARLNEHEGRLGCRTRACGSDEARADERRQTQGEQNIDLIFALRSQKNPREPSRLGFKSYRLPSSSDRLMAQLNFHERPHLTVQAALEGTLTADDGL